MKVVLDTNVVVSALIFRGGRLGELRRAWQTRQIIPLISLDTKRELIRVLGYPKFRLDIDEIDALLDEYLPYTIVGHLKSGDIRLPKDPSDEMFLSLAFATKAHALVTGDKDLLQLSLDLPFEVISPAELLDRIHTV